MKYFIFGLIPCMLICSGVDVFADDGKIRSQAGQARPGHLSSVVRTFSFRGNFKELLDSLFLKAKESKCERLGFHGIASTMSFNGQIEVNELSEIPFEELLDYVAKIIAMRFTQEDGLCVLYGGQHTESELKHVLFKVSPSAHAILGVTDHSTPQEVADVFSIYGIAIKGDSKVSYDSESAQMLVYSSGFEIELIRSLFTLIDRGIRVQPALQKEG